MQRVIACLVLLTCIVSAVPASAGLGDCQNLYVGRIDAQKTGAVRVVFLNAPTDLSGSYWMDFTGWAAHDRAAALTILVTARAQGQRVNFGTEAPGGCDALVALQTLSWVQYALTP